MEVFSIHTLFEMLAYAAGGQWFWRSRRRSGAARLPSQSVPVVVAGLLLGALLGAKVLAWLESPVHYWSLRSDPRVWIGGKTIVGGVLGGWIGVELGKKIAGWRTATGDLFVFPVLLGMAIGRVGCFFAGLEDKTYGLPTSLPWGVDFGDGISRHPTQLYEIALLALLGVVLWRRAPALPNGRLFREMMIGYLLMRFAVDFLKPRFTYPLVSLSAIQMACLAGLSVAAWQISRVPQELPADG
ncbi:MAG: prolipoprotein diacylglyceryl transferase [Planctomycetota bacterium]